MIRKSLARAKIQHECVFANWTDRFSKVSLQIIVFLKTAIFVIQSKQIQSGQSNENDITWSLTYTFLCLWRFRVYFLEELVLFLYVPLWGGNASLCQLHATKVKRTPLEKARDEAFSFWSCLDQCSVRWKDERRVLKWGDRRSQSTSPGVEPLKIVAGNEAAGGQDCYFFLPLFAGNDRRIKAEDASEEMLAEQSGRQTQTADLNIYCRLLNLGCLGKLNSTVRPQQRLLNWMCI